MRSRCYNLKTFQVCDFHIDEEYRWTGRKKSEKNSVWNVLISMSLIPQTYCMLFVDQILSDLAVKESKLLPFWEVCKYLYKYSGWRLDTIVMAYSRQEEKFTSINIKGILKYTSKFSRFLLQCISELLQLKTTKAFYLDKQMCTFSFKLYGCSTKFFPSMTCASEH